MQYQWKIALEGSDDIDLTYSSDGSLSQRHQVQEFLILEKELYIPFQVFRNGYSVLQASVRYLRDVYALSFAEIARLLERDQRTIWASYHQTSAKLTQQEGAGFPVTILANRSLSALEGVVKYLLERGIRVQDIALRLGRNVQTIYTTRRNLRAKGVSI